MQPQQGEAGTDDAGVPGAPTVHHSPHSHRNSHTLTTQVCHVLLQYTTPLTHLTPHFSLYTSTLSLSLTS